MNEKGLKWSNTSLTHPGGQIIIMLIIIMLVLVFIFQFCSKKAFPK